LQTHGGARDNPRAMNETLALALEPHPLLAAAAFECAFPAPLGELASPAWLTALFALEADAPVQRDEPTREAIRRLLRHGGYKPTGRGKPSSEYLVRAVGEKALASINLAVDACNAVSLASGLPISVVDLARARAPFRVALAGADASYVFNASGQTIDIEGLLCLFDADGPCANAVKDAQRTKTTPATTRTLSVLWGAVGLEARTARALAWYRELLERAGARTTLVPLP
jgi:DNA/RNA-binding domain of Phe-tRNA-synthetase-like protein